MSGHIIAIVNMKGGVGKTSTVVSLSEALAADAHDRVLVIDLDAQANASYSLAGDDLLAELIESGRTIDAYFEDVLINNKKKNIQEYIRKNISDVTHSGKQLNISLLPSSPQLRTVEREIIYIMTERKMSLRGIEGQVLKLFSGLLPDLQKQYRYIIFDCGPGISAFTEVAIKLANLVIVPSIPDFLSNLGLNAFCKSVWNSAQIDQEARPRLPHVLACRKRDTPHQNVVYEAMRNEAEASDAGFAMFETVIPETIFMPLALEQVGKSPTFSIKYAHPLRQRLQALVAEVKGKLHGTRN